MRKLLYEGFLPSDIREKEMNKIKLLALDLDGTTLRTNNTLSQKVGNALKKAAANGIEVVAASGRPYHSMPKEIFSLDCVNYVISSNGAAIHDKNGTRIHENLMEEADVIKLLQLTEDADLIWEAFQNGATYTDNRYLADPLRYGCPEAYIGYVQNSRGGLDDMRQYIFENRKSLDSVEFVCTDKKLRESLRRRLTENLDGLYITSSSENFVEFMNKTATKSNAIHRLCDYLNIDQSHTAACGNADNDADMVAHAGLGAAVANASASCKAAANIIVPSCDEDGVAKLIEIILKQ